MVLDRFGTDLDAFFFIQSVLFDVSSMKMYCLLLFSSLSHSIPSYPIPFYSTKDVL